VRQVIPVFYALGDTRTPVIVSALDLVAFIVIAFVLRGPMGHVGISAAIAGSSAVQMLLLVVALKHRLGTIRAGEIGASMARTLVSSIAAGVAGASTASSLAPHLGGHLARLMPGIVGGVVFVAVFVVVARIVGSSEQALLLAGVKRRILRRR
jgi:putative peptidoglycan lipid II flippase